jgi:hypothetical protein
MKRLLLLLVLSAVSVAAPTQDDFRDKLLVYHLAYDAWLRKFVGCPVREEGQGASAQVVTCNPALGGMDLRLWQKSREAAKTLYGLKERDE